MKILQMKRFKNFVAIVLVLIMTCPVVVKAEGEIDPENSEQITTETSEEGLVEEVTEETEVSTTEAIEENTEVSTTEAIEENTEIQEAVTEATITEETSEELLESGPISVAYRAHVQNIGWQDYMRDGATAGTQGRALRTEALQIKLENVPYSGGVSYRAHVQNIGWQDWVSDNAVAGTSGRALRIEALQIKLTGEFAEYYDIYYRLHVQNYGWLGWAKNGMTSGTMGCSYRAEGVEIRLVEKGGSAPGSTRNVCHNKSGVSYRTHVQNIGWQSYVTNGNGAGTSGQALRLEAINIKLNSADFSGGITYSTHVQNIGWQEYKSDGAMSGTSGQALRLEAIKIKLTGEIANYYDVYYRVHCQDYGWLKWVKNDELAGTVGKAKRLEAIQIFLCEKNEDPEFPAEKLPGVNSSVRKLDPNRPMVALTYDDGPYGPYTNRILDSLQANGGKATFFVVGNRVASNASVVKRASDMGCQIANHTWSHPQLMSMSVAGVQNEINRCNSAVASVTGKAPTMVRPVGGGVNARVKSAVNYPMINWSVDTMDWKYRNADHVYHAVVNNVHDGDIVLMHDIHGTTAAASERIIPELTRRGYQLVTVEELAYYKHKQLSAHNLYNSCK